MKLIDRYVTEVGKHLPLIKGRKDIENELRSTLEDMLEERAEKAGHSPDEAMEIELLKEYGSPQEVAETYNPHPYIIGPRTYPIFLLILKIVIPIVVIVLLVLTGIEAVTDTPFMGLDFVRIVGNGLAGIVSAAITAFGHIVLIFAILERVLPDSKINEMRLDEDWDPALLSKEPDPDSVKRGELIVEIAFTFLGLAILNLYSEILLGISIHADDPLFLIPIFSDLFLKFIPWINAVIIAEIVLDIYLLRKAAWDNITRIAKIIIESSSLAITVIFIRTPGMIGFTADSFTNSPFTPGQAETFTTWFTYTLMITLIIILIIQGVELAKALYGLWKVNYKTRQ